MVLSTKIFNLNTCICAQMYIEDVVSREQPVAAEAQKRSISGSESDTRNAKRQRTDECCFPDELANLGGIEEKQDPLDELDISESLANLPTPQFKKPVSCVIKLVYSVVVIVSHYRWYELHGLLMS